jgi:hypothetical protein
MVIEIRDDDGDDSDDNIVIVKIVMILVVMMIMMMILIGNEHAVRLVYLFGLETGIIFNAVNTFILDLRKRNVHIL